MSNRLESLNGKKPLAAGAAKTSLKFKPKVVSRRTKEERAKDAPVIKSEDNSGGNSFRGSGARGGRGGARGGRGGRNNYAGTHLVSLGPLSSGSVSIGGNMSGSKTGFTRDRVFNSQSPTPEYLQNLKLKDLSLRDRGGSPGPGGALSGGSTPLSTGYFSDDDIEDATRINMNEEYRFADEETVLFPVRPQRDDGEVNVDSKTPTPESTPAPELAPVTVKSEEPEDQAALDLAKLKQEEAIIETKLAKIAISLEEEELQKSKSDFKEMSSFFEGNGKYMAIHLPKVLPTYHQQEKEQPEETATNADEQENKQPVYNSFSAIPYPEKGQIGRINIHKSGKITINLGNNNILDVTKGMPTNFLQEVVVLEMDNKKMNNGEETTVDDEEAIDVDGMDETQPKGKLIRLGPLNNKLIGTPAL